MNSITTPVADRVQREVSRQVGYRLITWALAGLMAAAIFVVFRLFRDFPPAVDNWILWISPLMMVRGLAALILQRQLQHLYLREPSLTNTGRMSLLFGVSDGLLVLTANIIFSGFHSPSTLVMVTVVALSLLPIIYVFTPGVVWAAAAVTILPSLVLAYRTDLQLPPGLVVAGAAILAATFFAMTRIRGRLLDSLRRRFSVEQQAVEASESNFIFNQHWQKSPLATIDWDAGFRVRSWNPAAERLFGISADDAQGQSPELILDAEHALALRRKWHAMQRNDQACSTRHLARTADGDCLTTRWHDTPLTFEGEPIGIASMVEPLEVAGLRAETAPEPGDPSCGARVGGQFGR